MEFRKYMHVERFGNDEVQGIEFGECLVFPKIDGTNACIWMDGDDICCGSRNRQLLLENDNQGFMAHVCGNESILEMVRDNPAWIFYGEWLVPHSLRTYREGAWRKFYLFDVWDTENRCYLPYDIYSGVAESCGVEYIPPICIIKNGKPENFQHELDNNVFLIEQGNGYGEGIVIKNYDFKNRFGRTVWAKIVRNEFKDEFHKRQPTTVKEFGESIESKIANEFVTQAIVDKVYANIVSECGGWSSKYIPRLLGTVHHDVVTEELWGAIKKHKNPAIDFSLLQRFVYARVKELLPNIF